MTEAEYWNEFYAGKTASELVIPSQFAAFVASEYGAAHDALIDVGCGTGRDTAFFQRVGFPVVGLDASQEAVSRCQANTQDQNAQFLCASVAEPDLANRVRKLIAPARSPLVYARFFLHAVNDEVETQFLRFASDIIGADGIVAVEFRTVRDKAQAKVTPSHYRRYIDPMAFAEKVGQAGCRVSYFVEGFGYAKYREDDAHVARFILEGNS